MNFFEPIFHVSNYQFQPWPTNSSRPQSKISPMDDSINDFSKLTLENSISLSRPSSSSKPIRQYHVHIPTASRINSPPPQPNPSPDLTHRSEVISRKSTSARRFRSIPFRLKSTSFSLPSSKNHDQLLQQNFPRQTHEQRKSTNERKRQKQQAQVLADKYAESDSWFQLKRTLTELKRLATTQDTSLHENEEEYKTKFFQSESSTSAFSLADFHQNSFTRPRTSKIASSPRVVFEPMMATAKPIYPFSLPHPSINPSKSRTRSSQSRRIRSTPLTTEKRARLLLSDLSNDDNPPNSISPSPPMIRVERETSARKRSTPSPTRLRPPSIVKLNPPPPRSHSETDMKSSSIKFICICDQEHRIESWFHQYPFILSDDLIQSFQTKSSLNKSPTISAFFIDDLQSSNPNLTAKTFLQGKPFHVNTDWKKYDLILISNNIYERIISQLRSILNLNKSPGKIIQIYQLNHEEDLKKQVKYLCKQFQQNL